MGQGFSAGKLDKIDREIERNIQDSVPFSDWTVAQQMRYSFYWTGGGCASTLGACSSGRAEGSGFNREPPKERVELGLTEQEQEDIDKILREFDLDL